jgi:multidrug efflux pump subunit AcrB
MTAALNEGKPAPIDVRIKGNKLEVLRDIAERVRDKIRGVDGVVDARVLQRLDQPTKEVDIDRERAARMGVDPVDAIKNMVAAFSSTATFDKSFWIDEGNGNHYYVGVTYPEYEIDGEDVLGSVLVSSSLTDKPIPFRNFSIVRDRNTAVEINHHNLSRVFNVYANVDGRDVGRTSADIEESLSEIRSSLPSGYTLDLDGEVSVMRSSFANLGLGLGLALLFAYLIVVPLFRSFKQPIGMLLAFPPALAGVIGLLYVTGTPLSIQALMGSIMVVGITVSYGNLLVDRINKLRADGMSVEEALIEGSRQRLRPIIMTALTTVLGLLPTAIGFGGSSINQPLALAVIGGTSMAALLTLYVVPAGYRFFSKSEL